MEKRQIEWMFIKLIRNECQVPQNKNKKPLGNTKNYNELDHKLHTILTHFQIKIFYLNLEMLFLFM